VRVIAAINKTLIDEVAPAASAKTFIAASTSFRCRSRRGASAARILALAHRN
jgi:hypothetical protein